MSLDPDIVLERAQEFYAIHGWLPLICWKEKKMGDMISSNWDNACDAGMSRFKYRVVGKASPADHRMMCDFMGDEGCAPEPHEYGYRCEVMD